MLKNTIQYSISWPQKSEVYYSHMWLNSIDFQVMRTVHLKLKGHFLAMLTNSTDVNLLCSIMKIIKHLISNLIAYLNRSIILCFDFAAQLFAFEARIVPLSSALVCKRHQNAVSIYYSRAVNLTYVTFPAMGWWEITRAVLLCTNRSFPPSHHSPPSLLSPIYPTSLLSPCVPLPPSLFLCDVCSQILSSGTRCRRSGKSSLGGTGWQRTSSRRFPPLSHHMRRSLSLRLYNQYVKKCLLMTMMESYRYRQPI